MLDRLRSLIRARFGFALARIDVVRALARVSVRMDRLQLAGERGIAVYLALALLAAAAGLMGYVFMPEAQAHASVQPEIQLAGSPVAAGEDVHARALQAARGYLRSAFALSVGPWEFETTRAALGVRVDLEALEAMLRAARDDRSPLRRLHLQERGDLPLALEVPARLEGDEATRWLMRIKDQVYQRARDARVDLRSGQLVPEQKGFALDVHATLDAVAAAVLHGRTRVVAPVLRSGVTRTRAALENRDFSAVLGSFESRYNGLDVDRTFNLRVAARHVDGVVLMPGEVFDFNRLVGERSEANGFRPAPVIASGELTDGVGGGTCQIAGTLHAAVFFSGLPFLERYPHTRPSAYLKLGLDATVSYPKLNFKFRNDLPHAVAVGVEVGGGRVRAELRGPKRAQREVSFVRRIDKLTPYTEVARDDASLPAGVKLLGQRGVAGFEVTSFRLIRAPGSETLVRERRHDVYPPTTQIWRVGRGPAAPPGYKPPPPDSHGEYSADEYLILSMGPSTQGPQEVLRHAGRSGAPGWTAREGMPQVP
jgi:vancomycin resistance protein YoaR